MYKRVFTILILQLLLFFIQISTKKVYSQDFWQETGFSAIGQVRALLVSRNGDIYAGHDTGIFKSTNNGNTWTLAYSSLSKILSLAQNDSNGYIYAGSQYHSVQSGVYLSTDNGNSWFFKGVNGISIVDLAVSNNGTVFAASAFGFNLGGIFISTNNGTTWSHSVYLKTYCLAFDNNNNIYAGTMGEITVPPPRYWPIILKSTNGGNSWPMLAQWYQYRWAVSGIVINNIGYIFAYFDMPYCKVFRSTNNGSSWSYVQIGHWFDDKTPMIVNSRDHVFLGTIGGGVFRTTNDGSNWFQINSGLTDLQIFSLAFDSSEYIYAGTYDKIFKSTQITTSILLSNTSISPIKYSLYQNYPNPFNPRTNIKFDIPEYAHVSLIIYNILGKEIATLVNEKLNTGIYEVSWDATGFPSGVYFYKLIADDFINTKRMLLVK